MRDARQCGQARKRPTRRSPVKYTATELSLLDLLTLPNEKTTIPAKDIEASASALQLAPKYRCDMAKQPGKQPGKQSSQAEKQPSQPSQPSVPSQPSQPSREPAKNRPTRPCASPIPVTLFFPNPLHQLSCHSPFPLLSFRTRFTSPLSSGPGGAENGKWETGNGKWEMANGKWNDRGKRETEARRNPDRARNMKPPPPKSLHVKNAPS